MGGSRRGSYTDLCEVLKEGWRSDGDHNLVVTINWCLEGGNLFNILLSQKAFKAFLRLCLQSLCVHRCVTLDVFFFKEKQN